MTKKFNFTAGGGLVGGHVSVGGDKVFIKSCPVQQKPIKNGIRSLINIVGRSAYMTVTAKLEMGKQVILMKDVMIVDLATITILPRHLESHTDLIMEGTSVEQAAAVPKIVNPLMMIS